MAKFHASAASPEMTIHEGGVYFSNHAKGTISNVMGKAAMSVDSKMVTFLSLAEVSWDVVVRERIVWYTLIEEVEKTIEPLKEPHTGNNGYPHPTP